MSKERRAQQDKAIDLIAPNQNIDAPRAVQYAPVEYSGQIYAMEQEKQYKADIPKTLGAIAMDVNDYHSSINYGEEKVGIYKEETDLAIERKEYEEAQQLRVNNLVYDKSMQLQQSLFEAKKRGEISGDETGEVGAVLEEYKDPEEFAQNPYAQEAWAKHLYHTGTASTREALYSDLNTQKALRDNNINNEVNLAAARILHDGSTAEAEMPKFVTNARAFLENMEAGKVPGFLNNCWGAFIKEQVGQLKAQVEAGTLGKEEAATQIKALLSDSRDKTFEWRDAEGKVLLNDDGTPKTFRVTLAASDMYQLSEVSNGLKRSSSSGIMISANDFKKQFNETWKIAQFDETGYSDELRALNDSSAIIGNLSDTLDAISNSNWSDSQKAAMRDYVTNKGTQLVLLHTLASEMNASKLPYASAQNLSGKLAKDLAGGYTGDWSQYSLEIKRADGSSGKVTIPPGLRTYVNDDQTAKLYWSGVSAHLEKFVGKTSSPANFLSATDRDYNSYQKGILDTIAGPNGQKLVTGEPTQRELNKQTMLALGSAIDTAGTQAEAKGIGHVPLSDGTIDNLITFLDSPEIVKAGEDKAVAISGLAQVLTDKGCSAYVLDYLSTAKFDKDVANVSSSASMLQTALLIQYDKPMLDRFVKQYAAGADTKLMKSVTSSERNAQNVKDSAIVSDANALLNNQGIPVEYHPAIRNMAVMVSKVGLTKDQAETKELVKNVIKNNFESFDKNKYGIGCIYKHSSVLRNQDSERFKSLLQTTKAQVANIRVANGVSGADVAALGFKVNERQGTLNLALAGKAITVPNKAGDTSAMVSLPIAYTRLDKTGYPVQAVADVATAAITSALLATDDSMSNRMNNYVSPKQMYDKVVPEAIKKGINYATNNRIGKELIKVGANMVQPGMGYLAAPVVKGVKHAINNQPDLHVSRSSAQKVGFTYAAVLNDPEYQADVLERKFKNPGKAGAIMEAYPTAEEEQKVNKALRVLYTTPKAKDESYHNTMMIFRDAEKHRIYAGHISQGHVSNPVALAAAGQKGYIDQYSVASAAGYTVTGVNLPGVVNSVAEAGRIVGAAAPIESSSVPEQGEYTTSLSNSEEQAFQEWWSSAKEQGQIHSADTGFDYDYRGFWKNEVMAQTEQASANSETHFPDTYKKPWHKSFSVDSMYAKGANKKYAGTWDYSKNPDGEYVPSANKWQGQPTGMAADIKYSRPELEGMAEKAANKYGVPVSLYKALITQESGWQQGVKSKAGAQGIAQFMPATAKSFGINPLDPVQALDAGAKLLYQGYKAFGSWELALASYNAGGPAVRKYKGIPPYAETKRYVSNIMKMSGLDKTGTYSVDIGLKDNYYKFMDTDMDMLKPVSVTKFVNMVNDTEAYKGKVESIVTNRPELTSNKPEYADFAEFRKLKGASGKPLFVKGDVDGFRINVKKEPASGKFDIAAKKAVVDDMQQSQSPALPQSSYSTFSALLDTFADRYDTRQFTDGDCSYGIANMTAAEYQEYGVPTQALENPVMQSRVLAQEFQRASDILGNTRKAVFALAGGNMVDAQGNLKSWSDIKKDKDAYRKKWLIKPSADKALRESVNGRVAAFYNAYQQAEKEA